ncbi:hypothetical protein EMIHUDRAFT_228707 [Emiliania huxleyi CCMP1516]|uniref:HNH domain-containing protein n=2 Tax=Emiliania huxleyi TaxID=2903 RepID=A0A0D3KFG4_EMIH1|nr:hypothetical protein EMIHUDRAFT_228707 [Emiliania huxleyi CCMP1516]EOD34499.1 hypothetical protein EMIHUDRAFT_228707 [Emiliania huxleyi CCMP1516]|eukprot:XP_005786928.1 hypothetical protein EMIHUDRAFT_228707 [Emiliania huxleyi CCMP1516]
MSAQRCTDFAELTRWTEAELRDEINERHGMVRVNQTHGMLVNCLCNIRHAQRASELRRQESHLAIAFASLPLDLTMRSFHSGLSLARKAAEKGCLRDECSNCCSLLKTKKLYCNTDCQREFELRSADDNGRSLRARTLKQSGYKCSNCDIKGLISKANKHVESTLAPSASLADYKAAYTSYFKSSPDFKVARLAPFVRLHKEKMRIQRGSLLHADHILAVRFGGGCAGLDNMQSLCAFCHKNKSAAEAVEAARAPRCSISVKTEEPLSVIAMVLQAAPGNDGLPPLA